MTYASTQLQAYGIVSSIANDARNIFQIDPLVAKRLLMVRLPISPSTFLTKATALLMFLSHPVSRCC